MTDHLHNVFWSALNGPQAHLACGSDTARRYARGYTPLLGFADPQAPDFAALAPFCEAGEQFYCADWTGPAQPGWKVDLEASMYRMAWDAEMPGDDAAPESVPLRAEQVDQAVQLAALTRPGPFGPRTIEMGEYFGLFEGSRLVAMSGERMHAPGLREVSGVCTHPDFQGRGLARRLMEKLIRRQLQRGERPFLHVMAANAGAVRLYERMGFVIYRECPVRVVTRT
ncbi:MAG: acetyltransferase [Ramlibacter sp.]|nr:acetyltransferase [Ramlibacter sp.]